MSWDLAQFFVLENLGLTEASAGWMIIKYIYIKKADNKGKIRLVVVDCPVPGGDIQAVRY